MYTKKIRFDFLQPCLYEFDLIFQFSLFQEMTKTYILLSDWFFFFYDCPTLGAICDVAISIRLATHSSVLRFRIEPESTDKTTCLLLDGSIFKKREFGSEGKFTFRRQRVQYSTKKLCRGRQTLLGSTLKFPKDKPTDIEWHNPQIG